MFKAPLDLSSARILLSNDDGIHAPGLKALEKTVRKICRDVWVVAPESEQSGAGHSLTLQRPLRLRKLSARRYAVDGTPTDCILLAIKKVLKKKPPTLVLSGVNRGGNLGEDMTYSGTIAAAMEATLLGIPAIALSQVTTDGEPARWSTATKHLPQLLERLTTQSWSRNALINVNFPDCAAEAVSGIRVVPQGGRKIGSDMCERVDPNGRPYFWFGSMRVEDKPTTNSDLGAIRENAISVTPLNLDLTHKAAIKNLKKVFP